MRIRRLAERAIDAAAIATFTGILACVLAQVVFRYALNDPLTWSEELARYLFIWCAFLGWIIASRRGSHLAIGVVHERLPRGMRTAIDVAIHAATLAFAWILGSRGARLVANNWDVENTAVPFNLGVVYLIEPVAAAAIGLYALEALVATLRGRPVASEAPR
jgi:TRAP-type C4-dicarboxylate transport system permease small subunit